MGFMRYARASVVRPHIDEAGWGAVRTAAKAKGVALSPDLMEQASSILGQFNPKDYLWTHATIVCSVDVYSPPNVAVGQVRDTRGQMVNRKYSDYRVTPETQKYINANYDCWSRAVLLKSFKTFIGGQNYVEHVQVLELSKGRIIDAVARDLGESVYVDLLIATSLKHKDLIQAIKSGQMNALSMGCSITESTCTKCGNVAHDETDMCSCVKYEKGSTFLDELGQTHIVAELCGHPSIEPTGGNTFYEASWVENPAFKGAVLRSILTPDESQILQSKMSKVLMMVPPEWKELERRKAANLLDRKAEEEESWGEEEEEAPAEEPQEASPPASALDEAEDRVFEKVVRRVVDRVDKELAKGDAPQAAVNQNDNVIKQGTVAVRLMQAVAKAQAPSSLGAVAFRVHHLPQARWLVAAEATLGRVLVHKERAVLDVLCHAANTSHTDGE